MRNYFLSAIASLLALQVCAQVNPKLLKTDPVLNKVPVSQLPVNNLIRTVNYIHSNGFFAADLRSNGVVTSVWPSATGVFQWVRVNNPDGTVTWLLNQNQDLKLVYRRSALRTGNIGGLSGSGSASSFAVERVSAGASSDPAYKITDKWYLHSTGTDQFWMVQQDRLDSFLITLYKEGDVNNVDLDFNSMNGWNTEPVPSGSNAFAGQPSSVNFIPFFDSPVIPDMPLGGSYWKGLEETFFCVNTRADLSFINTARPGTQRWARPDERRTGTLSSLPFVNCGNKMTFRVAGMRDESRIRFELLQRTGRNEPGAVSFPDGFYRIVSFTSGHGNDITRQIVWNTQDQLLKVCRLRIIDQAENGHIIIDHINLAFTGQTGSDPVPADPVIPAEKPVWGAIDMHTHPLSYLGMGGKLMYGKLDGDPATALGNCNAVHGGWGTDNTGGNYLRAEIVNIIDEHYEDKIQRYKLEDGKVPHADHPHDGYPALINWPLQNSMTHQQMWYDWMRRAKEGGLTAIIALTVNSEVLGRVLGGDPPYDDKTVADRQIDSLIAFVHRHNDFLDTVTSASRMRQVIRAGKMAVIIGMEVDNLGNFYENVPVTEAQIRNEIARLKNKGVRYIFPIHVTDNKFGGTAVYKTIFNLSNKYVTAQPITGTVPVEMYPPMLPGHFYQVEVAPDPRVKFRLEGKNMFMISRMRPLVDIIELGGLPPDPLLLPVKPIVDPIILALKLSQQYQLAKKIFLDPNLDLAAYDGIRNPAGAPGGHRNVRGLSTEGDFAIRELMRQGMMIDVDHASERSVNDIIRIAQSNNYPVNSGHNALRGNNDNEKTRTPEQLHAIADLGGMFGIGWENQNPVTFNSIFGTHLRAMGNRNTTFGSDIDGYAATPEKPVNPSQFVNYSNRSAPDFLTPYRMPGSTRQWNYNTEGMAHIGLVPDFFEALKKAGANPEQLNQLLLSAEYFARMWERCDTQSRSVH